MGLFGNLFGGGRQQQPAAWSGAGNAPYMVGQPAGFGMGGSPPEGFAGVQPTAGQGGGHHILDILNSFLTNFSASQGDPAALSRVQMRAEQARQEREQQQAMNNTRSNFLFEQEYRQAHPAPQEPDEFTRTLTAAGIDPTSPQARTMYQQRAQQLASPPVAVDEQRADGSIERHFITRPAPAAPPPPPQPGEVRAGHRYRGGNPADPASWEPLTGGGAGPSGGPATFPRQDGGAFDFNVHPTSR